MKLGLIGLGVMGRPMALNLMKHGHEMGVYSRRAETAAPLVAAGARRYASPAELAAEAEVVFTMVMGSSDVEEVVLGENGIASAIQPGSLVIDHSTIDPAGARRIASELQRQNVEMLDAPVSGGGAAAEAGTLAIMAGGSTSAFDRGRPLLSCYATSIVHIGPSGAGQVAKACNQICTIVNQLGAAEAMLLAERAGVDPRAVKEALMGGFAASRMLDLQAPKMIARDFEGKVESRLHHKDIHIVLELARTLGIELPASTAAAHVLDTLQERGGARQDSAAMIAVLDVPR